MRLKASEAFLCTALQQKSAIRVYAVTIQLNEIAVITPEIQTIFATFMRAHQNRVYSLAARLLADQRQAEDVAQEVFLKAYKQGKELWTDERAKGWLSTVTRNACFNHLTRYRKRYSLFSEHLDSDDSAEEFMDTPAANATQDTNPTSTALEQAEQSAQLQQAVLQLPYHQRIPIVLYHFEDMGYEEIAQFLNIALSKLKTDIHRGRLKLATLLDRPLNERML